MNVVLRLTYSPASSVSPVQCQENSCGLWAEQSSTRKDFSSSIMFRKLSTPQRSMILYYHVLVQQVHLRRQNQGTKSHAGRAIAQAVSRRLPTASARIRAQVRSCGICGE
jgi:hypothetical protein